MQQVHINRLGINSIEFETDIVELPLSPGEERSFELVMINYGAPTHVNLSVSDSLRENITVLEDNPYVKHEDYIPLIARIPYDGRLYTKGQVFITVGYGSKRQGFNLNLGNPGPNETNFVVDVDESLYKPKPISSSSSSKGDSSSFGGGHRSGNRGSMLPPISSDLIRSAIAFAASNSIGVFVVILLLISVIVLAILVLSIDTDQLFGFYQSVLYSILITFFMAYLLLRLPKSKR